MDIRDGNRSHSYLRQNMMEERLVGAGVRCVAEHGNRATLYIQLWDAAVQARCHANSTIWKVLGNVADYAALRHAERVVLSVCSDEEADNAALRHTIEETLGGLDYCRSVKRLDITITVGTFLYTDIDQKGIDSLIDGFKSIECPGDITTEVEDENGGDFDRKNYQELVDKLKA